MIYAIKNTLIGVITQFFQSADSIYKNRTFLLHPERKRFFYSFVVFVFYTIFPGILVILCSYFSMVAIWGFIFSKLTILVFNKSLIPVFFFDDFIFLGVGPGIMSIILFISLYLLNGGRKGRDFLYRLFILLPTYYLRMLCMIFMTVIGIIYFVSANTIIKTLIIFYSIDLIYLCFIASLFYDFKYLKTMTIKKGEAYGK